MVELFIISTCPIPRDHYDDLGKHVKVSATIKMCHCSFASFYKTINFLHMTQTVVMMVT